MPDIERLPRICGAYPAFCSLKENFADQLLTLREMLDKLPLGAKSFYNPQCPLGILLIPLLMTVGKKKFPSL